MNWEERGLRTAKTYLGSDICKNREESRIQGWGLTRSWSKNEGSKAGVMRKGTSVLVCWALGTYRQRCQQKAGRMHQKQGRFLGWREWLRCHQQAACKRKEGIRLLETLLLIMLFGESLWHQRSSRSCLYQGTPWRSNERICRQTV